MCKKSTSVFHSSAESEVVSLADGLRMDGIAALNLWDLVMRVLHSSRNIQAWRNRWREEVNNQASRNRVRNETQSTNTNTKTKRHCNREFDEVSTVDHVVTSATPSHFEAHLYIFEANEAVIKMIIKGRSPTMRRVSRTHRVALEWLFDRINLDPMIQIRYVDTKNQLADMLTEGNCTRDEWNHFLRVFNIMNLSMFSCSHFPSLENPKTMSKKSMQERRRGEEPVLAKSKPVSLRSKRVSVDSGCIIQSGELWNAKL